MKVKSLRARRIKDEPCGDFVYSVWRASLVHVPLMANSLSLPQS